MALANIAVLLAQQGLKILAVDWDLEAPGLERYFSYFKIKRNGLGLLRMLIDALNGTIDVNYKDYCYKIDCDTAHQITLIPSGREADEAYSSNLENFNWNYFFLNKGGSFVEKLRDAWKEEYDIILVDSRTGLSDTGGICTIQLPDIIVAMFTANFQSLYGVRDVMRLAQKSRQRLAYDRMPLSVLPLPVRWGLNEPSEANVWLGRVAEVAQEFCEDWLPKTISLRDTIDRVKIPQYDYFGFGEKLAVAEKGINAQTVKLAYEKVASFLASDLKELSSIVGEKALQVTFSQSNDSVFTSEGRTLPPVDSYLYDAYVSHEHTVREKVLYLVEILSEELSKRLGRKPNIFLEIKEVTVGNEFDSRSQEALIQSKILLPVLTSTYFNKKHTKREFQIFHARSQAVERNLIYPIIFDSGDYGNEVSAMQCLDARDFWAGTISNNSAGWHSFIKIVQDAASSLSVILENLPSYNPDLPIVVSDTAFPSRPTVFLSHSSADTEAARELKRRLLASPDAKATGLKVWFDKDDLRPGEQWQPQIEHAIAAATAFVVYVGARGVINWVDAEVCTALSRAATDKDFLFIPVLAPEIGANALPSFARLHQAVADPLGEGDGMERLLKAVTWSDWRNDFRLIDEPFVGLRSMREEEADRFFGRDAEVAELVEKLRKHRLVAVVADSGAGKSSLAAAGFAPKFRGGALGDLSRAEPDERVWHVVTMRPGANPEEGLRSAVSEVAARLGRSLDERASLRRRIALADASETASALQCDLPCTKTATLLIVDQFEELLTQTPEVLLAPFVRLLLALADSDKDFRILLTVRADYFNLVSAIPDVDGKPAKGADDRTLYGRLTANGGDAILRLKRISDAGLVDAIVKPLRLAGDRDEAAQEALVTAFRRDISDQPSDLPLMQVALRAAWREHRATGIQLLEAYQSVGGVLGALANEAELARGRLPPEDRARLESVFVRLVLLGDTGGATRRTAALDEFDEPRQVLLRRLAEDGFGRLVVVGEATAQLAHEALITQWPWLQRTLREDARDVRSLGRLMDNARAWIHAPQAERAGYLATGAERLLFQDLAKRRPDWISQDEAQFVAASDKAYVGELSERAEEQARKLADARTIVRRTLIGSGVAAFLSIAAALFGMYAYRNAIAASEAAAEARAQADRAKQQTKLATLASLSAASAISPDGASMLLIKPDGNLSIISLVTGNETINIRASQGITAAAFSPDARRVAIGTSDGKISLWDLSTMTQIAHPDAGHSKAVRRIAFSPDGRLFASGGDDALARVWSTNDGGPVGEPIFADSPVVSAAFSPDGARLIFTSQKGSLYVFDTLRRRLVP